MGSVGADSERVILVLGGGVAGLAAAERLAMLGHEVTVVQRGHRLGGKGASHRTAAGRIIEHGLHVWPGYYDNAFALMRRCHASTDGPPPGFFPAPAVGVANPTDWTPWVARFSSNDKRPGIDHGSPTVRDFVRQCTELLADLARTGAAVSEPPKPQVYLSGRASTGARNSLNNPIRLINDLSNTLLGAAITHLPRLVPTSTSTFPAVDSMLQELRRMLMEMRPRRIGDGDQVQAVIDLVITSLLGIYRDDLLRHPQGFAAVNDLDFREWLGKHGADQATLDCGVVRGMYDLVFGYADGDHGRPAFEAGTGLTLAARFFFDFKGALFWKMDAGMGDVVFAPLYRRLKTLGVRFRFFHRVDELMLDESGQRVQSVRLGRQAVLAKGVDEYEPLIPMDGYDVFPEHPLADQLAQAPGAGLEHHDGDRSGEELVELHAGVDFDQVVLAVSLGMVPHVCTEIVETHDRWQRMVESVTTVATQALQVWSTRSASELGWEHPGSTVAAYESPFDTYADMTHLVDVERTGDGTRSIAYFCSALPDADVTVSDTRYTVRANAVEFLEERSAAIWPDARTAGRDGGFDWDVLVSAAEGSARIDDQYVGANTDPSDRYVQSRPGSSAHRLRADDAGIANLFLAGDWIDSGLNAGCIEAAAIAGMQAANAAAGVALCDSVLGGWQPVGDRRGLDRD